jgi:hypothetical protein
MGMSRKFSFNCGMALLRWDGGRHGWDGGALQKSVGQRAELKQVFQSGDEVSVRLRRL